MTDVTIEQIVNIEHYPILEQNSKAYDSCVEKIRQQLDVGGCSVLAGFIRPEILQTLKQQGKNIAPQAYYKTERVNVYNTDVHHNLPDDSPESLIFERGNAFVAKDLIPPDYVVSLLYQNTYFTKFIADCFNIEQLYELSDPLAGLCLNVLQPGKQHPWHFDTNEFTVSLLTKEPELGGIFEYCPDIRSPEEENKEAVNKVIRGRDNERIKQLNLQCGDLQLFSGRYSLHRVSCIEGKEERHTAIFAYTKMPGIIGSVERTKQLFGRVLPVHIESENQHIRSDDLVD